MFTSFLLAAGLVLIGAAQNAKPVDATDPEPPASSVEELLRTALTEVLEKPFPERHEMEGPVLLLRDSPLISPRILPPKAVGVALLSREELTELAESGKRGYYLSMRLVSYSDETAVVSIYLGPLPRKNHLALCCWTQDLRYDHLENRWKFVRVVGSMIH